MMKKAIYICAFILLIMVGLANANQHSKPPPGSRINYAQSLTRGLVVAYPFSIGAGIRLVDNVNKLDGESVRQPTWVGGVSGTALRFDSSNEQYVTLYEPQELDFICGFYEFSISITFKTPIGGMGANGYLISKISTLSPSKLQYAISLIDSTNAFQVYTGESDPVDRGSYVDGQWTTVTLAVGLTTFDLYVDGVLVDSDSVAGSENAAGQDVLIGARRGDNNSDADTAIFAEVDIDQVKIWNRKLSAKEVKTDYQNPYYVYYAPPTWAYYVPPVPAKGNIFGSIFNGAVLNGIIFK